MEPRLARLMSTSCRNCSVRKWRHCAHRPYTGAHSFSGSRLNSTVDFKYCASFCFAFRHLPGQSNFRSGFPSVLEDMHTRMSVCSRRMNEPVQGSETILSDARTALWCMMLFLRSTRGQVISTPTMSNRFPTLRGFNLSHSKRRCQGQEQNAAWYVACGTPFL